MARQSLWPHIAARDEAYIVYTTAANTAKLMEEDASKAFESFQAASSAFLKAHAIADALAATRNVMHNANILQNNISDSEYGVIDCLAEEKYEAARALYKIYVARLDDHIVANDTIQAARMVVDKAWYAYVMARDSCWSAAIVS